MTPRDTLHPLRLLWLAAALLTVLAACTPLGGWLDGNVRVFGTRGVRVAVQVAEAGFGTKAAARTAADIGFYRFKLVNVGLATIAAQYQTTATAFTFSTVPNGTYQLKAEAFSAGGVSLTAGGEQTSANTATVASPAVTYSTGSSLALTIPLLPGTGETLYNRVIVTDGSPPGALVGAGLSATATVAGTFAVGITPHGLTVDQGGNIWVANSGSNTLTKLSPTGTVLGTFASGGEPWGLATDSGGNIWVTHNSANQIERFTSAGVSLGITPVGAGPQAIAFDPTGNAWVTNNGAGTVHKLTAAGASVAQVVTAALPRGLAMDGFGNPLVFHFNPGQVKKLDPGSGTVLGTITLGGFGFYGLMDPIGQVWATIQSTGQVERRSSGGSLLGTYAVGTNPVDIVRDPAGRIWVANSGSNSVTVLAANGVTLATIPVGFFPYNLTVDPQGYVWVSNSNSNTVSKLKL